MKSFEGALSSAMGTKRFRRYQPSFLKVSSMKNSEGALSSATGMKRFRRYEPSLGIHQASLKLRGRFSH